MILSTKTEKTRYQLGRHRVFENWNNENIVYSYYTLSVNILERNFYSMENERFLKVTDLMKRYGLSRSGVYKKCENKELPAGVKIGCTHRWKLSDILAFEAGL